MERPPHILREVTSIYDLFHKFLSKLTLKKICMETNRYAASIDPSTGKTRGPSNWWRLKVQELEAWLGIIMLMSLKVLPNRRLYCHQDEPFYYCNRIARTIGRKRFEAISKCLHVHNESGAPTDRNHPDFDKLAKLR